MLEGFVAIYLCFIYLMNISNSNVDNNIMEIHKLNLYFIVNRKQKKITYIHINSTNFELDQIDARNRLTRFNYNYGFKKETL